MKELTLMAHSMLCLQSTSILKAGSSKRLDLCCAWIAGAAALHFHRAGEPARNNGPDLLLQDVVSAFRPVKLRRLKVSFARLAGTAAFHPHRAGEPVGSGWPDCVASGLCAPVAAGQAEAWASLVNQPQPPAPLQAAGMLTFLHISFSPRHPSHL